MSEAGGNQFGKYEAVRELNQVGAATVYAAREAGTSGEARFAIKSLQVPAFLTADEARRRIRAFVGRANVQKKAAEASAGGSSHWAPIYGEPVATAISAYYVTDLYPRSAAELADGRRGSVNPAELWAVARDVAAGLAALQTSANRPHGVLKPGNVLLAGHGKGIRAFLADPLDNDDAGRQAGLSADLWALGDLIHRLVLHEPAPADPHGELPAKPRWGTLGPQADGWRRLCGRMLGVGEPLANLEELSAAIAALRPRPSRVWMRVATIAAIVAIAAAGAVAIAWKQCPFNQHDWERLCTVEWQPFSELHGNEQQKWSELQAKLEPFQRFVPDDFSRIESIGQEICKLVSPQQIAGQDVSLYELEKTGPVNGRCEAGRQVQADFRRIALIRRQLQNLIAATHAPTTTDDLNQPVRLLRELPVRIAWQTRSSRVEQDLADLNATATTDPFIRDFRDTLARSRSAPPDFHQNPYDLAQQLDKMDRLHDLARRMAGLTPDKYDVHRISSELSPRFAASASSGVDPQAVEDWLKRAASEYAYLPQDPRDTPASWTAKLDALDRQIRNTGAGEQSASFLAELKSLREEITGHLFHVQRPVAKDRQTLVAAAQTYRQRFDQFDQKVKRQLLDDAVWQDSMAKTVAPAGDQLEVLNAFWRTQREALLQQFRGNPSAALRRRVQDLLDLIQSVGREVDVDPDDKAIVYQPLYRAGEADAFPLLIKAWANAVSQAALDRRNAALRSVLDALPSPLPETDRIRETLTRGISEWRSWRRQTRTLVSDAAKISGSIDPAGGMYSPADPLPGQTTTLGEAYTDWAKRYVNWRDQVKPAIQDKRVRDTLDADPLDAVARAMDLATPASVSQTIAADKPAQAGLVLAAWRALPARIPKADPASFATELDLTAWSRLKEWAGQVKDQVRRDRLNEELSTDLAKHLSAWADRPVDPKAPEKPLAIAGADANVQYDVALYNLIRLAKDQAATEPAVAGAVKALQDVAGALKSPAPAEVQTVLSGLADARKGAAASPDARWGPEKLGWQKDVSKPGRVKFTRGNQSVDFVKLRVDGRDVYVATTELSAGIFFSLLTQPPPDLQASAAIDPLKQQMEEVRKELADRRKYKGPQVWATASTPSAKWVNTANPGFATGQGLRDSPGPTLDDYPMDFVPASAARQWAALFQCRLPTADEWKAALAEELRASQKRVSDYNWNLRDISWDLQVKQWSANIAYPEASSMNPDQWRWFRPARWTNPSATWDNTLDPKRPLAVSPNAQQGWNDHHLFFEPVAPKNAEAGAIFYHLIGNVGELVSDPASGSLSVIGGSAFSPPELGYDTPIPLPNTPSQPNLPAHYWSDVGFRLAMDAPMTPFAELVAKAVQGAKFLPG